MDIFCEWYWCVESNQRMERYSHKGRFRPKSDYPACLFEKHDTTKRLCQMTKAQADDTYFALSLQITGDPRQ